MTATQQEGKTPDGAPSTRDQQPINSQELALAEAIFQARVAALAAHDNAFGALDGLLTDIAMRLARSVYQGSIIAGLEEFKGLRLGEIGIQRKDRNLLPEEIQEVFDAAKSEIANQGIMYSTPSTGSGLEQKVERLWEMLGDNQVRAKERCFGTISEVLASIRTAIKGARQVSKELKSLLPDLGVPDQGELLGKAAKSSKATLEAIDAFSSEVSRQYAKRLSGENVLEIAEQDTQLARGLWIQVVDSALEVHKALEPVEDMLLDPETKEKMLHRAEEEARRRFFAKVEVRVVPQPAASVIPALNTVTFGSPLARSTVTELTEEEVALRSLLLEDMGFPEEIRKELSRMLSGEEISQMSEAGNQLGLPTGLVPLIVSSNPRECQDFEGLKRALTKNLGLVSKIYRANLQDSLASGNFVTLAELERALS